MPLLPLFLAGRLLAAVMVVLFRLLRFAVQHRGRMPLLPLFLADAFVLPGRSGILPRLFVLELA
jgi:hypothetical protein